MSDLRGLARPRETRPTAASTDTTPGWGPLAVVLTGTFVTFLDFFIVNVALPDISSDLTAAPSTLSLVVAGYGLTFAAGLITGGRLGDLYGRRRLFTIGLALFTVASAICGLAPSAGVLVVARVGQGAAASLLTPQVLAILGTVYDGERRGKAFAAYGLAMGIAGVLGQLLGGVLITADVADLGWRSIFLINLPVGAVALTLVGRVVPESRGPRAQLDLMGTVLGTVTVAALVLPLVEGREHDWPWWTWASLAAAPVSLVGFVAAQRRRHALGRAPLVDLDLFRARTFAIGSLAALAYALVPPSFFFVLALYLQQGRGYSALFSGVVFVAVGLGYFAAMMTAPRLAMRLGHGVLMLGAAVSAGGCLLLAATGRAGSSLDLTPGLALVGLGIGLVLVPLASTVLAGVDPRHAGAAAGVLSTAQQVGGAVGVALAGIVYFGEPSAVRAFVVSVLLIGGFALLACVLVAMLRPRSRAASH